MRMGMAGDVRVNGGFASCLLILLLFLSSEAVSDDDLFAPADGVTILSGNTSSSQRALSDRSHIWLVNFYSSWCGHCIRFAPLYKKLASAIKDWSGVVQLATLNCGARENLQTCTDYGITGYPTLRVLPAYSSKNATGDDYSGKREAVSSLENGIIQYLQKGESRLKQIPHLDPLSKLEDIWNDVGLHTKYTIVFFEEESSFLGRKVILDLSSRDDIVVRRMLENNAEKLGVKKFPSMYQINKSGTFDLLKSSISVHEQDLLSALSYSLRHEIAVKSSFSESSLEVLKGYIEVLSKYFPGSNNSTSVTFLHKLNSWLQAFKGDTLTSAMWLKGIQTLETEDAHIPETEVWVSCLGSKPGFRGYPCGMWLLFHTLTVRAADHSKDPAFKPKEVLTCMRSYIQEFFGCRECAKNFGKGAVYIEERVNTADDAILFLWRSHNKANFHLHGDETEDPAYPKIQFPSRESCPQCHLEKDGDEIKWDEGTVLTFLKTMFSHRMLRSAEKGVGLSGRIARLRDQELRTRVLASVNAGSMFSSLDVTSANSLNYCVAFSPVFEGFSLLTSLVMSYQ
ncbi:hypothetical protein CAPTEDRAFT_218956 [Capitella teleta]|uniref:Sulfhydryl oxidase n=1 Tax=Capitella teleta TaxID=283909 RepID=R7UJX8_CAPTE|nr:hypothetical protein CAPTEDRAFT_218956 [Capitella teleta]|eukprot:ELU03567.1 hypothetical protein CAPTEDRAFT_218956 [Capitella teleta]